MAGGCLIPSFPRLKGLGILWEDYNIRLSYVRYFLLKSSILFKDDVLMILDVRINRMN
jgi:hypothetical protein